MQDLGGGRGINNLPGPQVNTEETRGPGTCADKVDAAIWERDESNEYGHGLWRCRLSREAHENLTYLGLVRLIGLDGKQHVWSDSGKPGCTSELKLYMRLQSYNAISNRLGESFPSRDLLGQNPSRATKLRAAMAVLSSK
jgi:hypothetical protein